MTRDELRAAHRKRRPPIGPCLSEEQVLAFFSGGLEERKAESVRGHLADCSECLELSRDARKFLSAMAPDEAPKARPSGSPQRLLLLAASVAVAISAGLWVSSHARRDSPAGPQPEPSSAAPRSAGAAPATANPWQGLEIARAEYRPKPSTEEELVWRSGGDKGSADPLAPAMRAYERGEFAQAEADLAAFLRRNPNHPEAHFYRGVSLLLLQRPREAVPDLQTSARLARGPLREEALWFVARAQLKIGNETEALKLLSDVIAISGRHSEEAEGLRRRIQIRSLP